MGAYVYVLRSPKVARTIEVEKEDGTTEILNDVGSFSYLFKPRYYHGEYNIPYHAIMDRLASLWEHRVIPSFVVFTDKDKGHKIEEGSNVYRWVGNSVPVRFWNDESSQKREYNGKAKRIVK